MAAFRHGSQFHRKMIKGPSLTADFPDFDGATQSATITRNSAGIIVIFSRISASIRFHP